MLLFNTIMPKNLFFTFITIVTLLTTCNRSHFKSISLKVQDGYIVNNMYGDTMVFTSPYKNKILFWNVHTNDTFSIKLNLNFSIEDAFLNGSNFYVFDNRMFRDQNDYKIYKYNLITKSFIDTITISKVVDNGIEYVFDPVGSECPFYINGENIYFHVSPTILFNKSEKGEMSYFKHLNTILIKDSSKKIFANYPFSYCKKYYNDFYPMYLTYSDTLICCFRANPVCYRFCNGIYIDSVSTPSNHFQNFKSFSSNEWTTGKITDSIIRKTELINPMYYKLLHNTKTNYFYRIVYLSKTPEGKTVSTFKEKAWSLIKLDEKFNKISEKVFDQNKLDPSRLYPFDKGLIIQIRENKIYNKKITYDFEYIGEE